MTKYSLTMREKDHDSLSRALFVDDKERAAILLCGRSAGPDTWSSEWEERFLVREIVPIPEDAYLERSSTSFTWSTTPFFRALKVATSKGLLVAVAHSHPQGPLRFSEADDRADKELFEIGFATLDDERPYLSIIMEPSGEIRARAYGPALVPVEVSLVKVIGKRWTVRYPGRGTEAAAAALDRQVRAFGPAAVQDLSQLRVGVVGCGGTGSATLTLLARMGISRIALFDADRVDETNLNRLHFSSRADASLRKLKVEVAASGIASIGLPISITRFPFDVDSVHCREGVLSCDVLFGCTDDHLGRNFLNRISRFYLIPIIDLGLLIEPNDAGGYSTFDGRVTVVQPG